MTRSEQIIWAAGFLDGEGFIGVSRGVTQRTQKAFHQVLVDAAQARRAPLDALVELFGGRVRSGRRAYYWRVSGKQAEAVLTAIAPYLIAKKAQADLCLQYCATLCGSQWHRVSAELLCQRELLHAQLRVLNSTSSSHAERLSERAPLALVANG